VQLIHPISTSGEQSVINLGQDKYQQNHRLNKLSQRPALLSCLEQSLYVRACREPRLMGQDLVDVVKVL